jgi:protein ImuA
MMTRLEPVRDAVSAEAGLPDKAGGPGAALLPRLRRAVEAIEGTVACGPSQRLRLGIADLDASLGGGLAAGALHEIGAARESGMTAATGFALALAAHTSGPVVWITEDMALAESGTPYGPGLDDLGLEPERLVVVAAATSRDVLWAAEEALGCRGIGAVIGEMRTSRLDLITTRRLSLAAGHRGGLALLLRPLPGTEPSAASTRWIVKPAPPGSAGPAPALAAAHGLVATGPGPPRFLVTLARNRRGQPGSWELEWNCVEHRFDLAPARREPVAQAPLDRPRATGGTAPLFPGRRGWQANRAG